MNEITKWLNGPKNYSEGVALYFKYGRSEIIKKRLVLTGPPTQNLIETLIYELKKLETTIYFNDTPIKPAF
jgi:hypothetical protein